MLWRGYIEIERLAQLVKFSHFITILPVRSSKTDNHHPHLVVYLDIRKCTKKKATFSLNNSPRAAESSKFGAFYPWFFNLQLNYSQQCQIFWVTECGCQRPTNKPKIISMRPLALQLVHVTERYIEIERWAQMVKIWHSLTVLLIRSSETCNDHPHLVAYLGHREVRQEKEPHFSKELAQGCWKLKNNLPQSLV